MSSGNEIVKINRREWDALLDDHCEMRQTLERIERDMLVWRAKAAVVMAIIGIVTGIAVSIGTHFAIKLLGG